MKNIFITGGGGYIGTTLIPELLKRNYRVTVFDSLMFNNGDKLLPFIGEPDFTFVYGDVRDPEKLRSSIKNHDVVIHLAALVGFPLCREKGYNESRDVNVTGTTNVIEAMDEDQYLLFGSTGSIYGDVDGICTEETPLNPLSIYAKTKSEAESRVLSRKNSTALRFATAFGIAPRLRLDLLVNDLTYKAATESYAAIYEAHFVRTFIHVRDIAKAFLFAIDNQHRMADDVYNVGSDSMNYSKRDLCEIIKQHLPETYFDYAGIGSDADKRNYIVSYDKINRLGFHATVDIKTGIQELIAAVPLVNTYSPYYNALK
jgi:nucleoside-diphosphate-sugar epimerase